MIALLRSMRFAIAVLCVVAVAATIGSVLGQNAGAAEYAGRYGAHWSALFRLAGLDDVYHAAWFLGLLGFMAASTALCLWQRTPAMWREMRAFRADRSRAGLRRVPHQASWTLAPAAAASLHPALRALATRAGFAVRQGVAPGGWVLAARRGAGRRAGYLLVHGAMVLICAGGLVDGNLAQQWRMRRGDISPAPLATPLAEAPATARLAPDNASFRAMLTVAEGTTGSDAVLSSGDGYLVQPLPFAVRLRRFEVAHHANGQPRDFVSEIEIIDGARRLPLSLRVNQPASYRGVTLFQSGFDDGGSTLSLRLRGMRGDAGQPLTLRVGEARAMLLDGQPVTLEALELRSVNVFRREDAPPSWHAATPPGSRSIDAGPAVSLRLRDRQGQAEEWLAYQRPLQIEGGRWFVFGRRPAGEQAMRYLRLPADGAGALHGWHAWSAALNDPDARRAAAAAVAAGAADPQLTATLRASAEGLLERFADEGFAGIARFVPPGAEPGRREAGARLYLELLEQAAARLASGQPDWPVRDALLAYSEARAGGFTAVAELEGYQQVHAAVLQVARAPGAVLVYLGAALLALGVIAMYYIRERRLWLHYDGAALLLALDANRPSPLLDAELAALRAAVDQLLLQEVPHACHPVPA